MTAVHFVVPDGIEDPARPSGGNAYDLQVCRGLESLGWSVHRYAAPGRWPRADADALAGVARQIPAGAVALVDGLVASSVPEVLLPLADRSRLVVLVHMPLGHRPPDDAAEIVRKRERAVLRAAAAVVATSRWSATRLLALYQLAPDRVHVAEPGVDRAELATGTAGGGELLSVAAVTFEKGHDVLVDALLSISNGHWRCVCVGTVDLDSAFVEELRRRARDGGISDRLSFPGPRTASELDQSYAAADLLVLASRAETYGMVVTEALARGLPVLATEVGGVIEALGFGADGMPPGLLVPPDDPAALAAALRTWLGDAHLRRRLRRAAEERRTSLCGWSRTASLLAGVLEDVRR